MSSCFLTIRWSSQLHIILSIVRKCVSSVPYQGIGRWNIVSHLSHLFFSLIKPMRDHIFPT